MSSTIALAFLAQIPSKPRLLPGSLIACTVADVGQGTSKTWGGQMGRQQRLYHKLVFVTLRVLCVFGTSLAKACDPHENCHRCLAFRLLENVGSTPETIQPAKLEKNFLCQVPVVGPLLTAPETPFGPGGVFFGQNGAGVGPITGEDIKFCISKPDLLSGRNPKFGRLTLSLR